MSTETRNDASGSTGVVRRAETVFGFILLLILALIPTVEAFLRNVFHSGLPGSDSYVKHFVLLVAFAGGMITSAENRHLSIALNMKTMPSGVQKALAALVGFFTVMLNTAYAWTSLSYEFIGLSPDKLIGIIPVQLFGIVMPIGFTVMAIRGLTAVPKDDHTRLFAAVGFLTGSVLAYPSIFNLLSLPFPELPGILYTLQDIWTASAGVVTIPFVILLIIAGVFGTPIFVVLGGIALLLFARDGSALEVIPDEAYNLLTGTTMPAIPLFTLAGFILSESKSGERLVRLFRSLFGWIPGGMAIVAILVSAFFTTFTGASGVTILALGGLLSYILLKDGGYSEEFTVGLLTSVGSIGLLFPPSLPLILYGVSARVSVLDMFMGGLLPGFVMIVVISLFVVFISARNKAPVYPFRAGEAARAIAESFWELLLPVIIIAGFFSGLFTIVETAAVAVVYALILEMVIHREISVRDLPRVALKSLPIIGGVLIILSLAMGLSYYIIDQEVPMMLKAWVAAHIHSKFVFLLLLNAALLVTGCFMDIFSAILVVVPLITPLGALFGVNPIHLGIVFLTNMELGFLTPPVGLNLFLSSYRFNKPLLKIYNSVVPFLVIQFVILLLITYVPWFSTALLGIFGS